jgi:hypothetical protein
MSTNVRWHPREKAAVQPKPAPAKAPNLFEAALAGECAARDVGK